MKQERERIIQAELPTVPGSGGIFSTIYRISCSVCAWSVDYLRKEIKFESSPNYIYVDEVLRDIIHNRS